MARIDTLIKVANELQKICEFEPPIKTKGKSEKEIEKVIEEAAEALTPDDALSAEAKSVFKELKIAIGQPVPKPEKEEEEEQEEEEQEEEEQEEEEQEEQEEVEKKKPVKKKPVKEKPVKEKPVKAKKEKTGKPGIIAYIGELIEKADEKKGITKEEILKALVKQFPDRNETSMKATVNVQVPGRIKEKFEVGKTEDGGYFKKK